MAEADSAQRCVRLTISGRVQGVGYRAWAQSEATERGLTGWVRNRANGDVEALVCGLPDVVQSFSEICRSGPSMARVDQIVVADAESGPEGVPGAFVTLPSL